MSELAWFDTEEMFREGSRDIVCCLVEIVFCLGEIVCCFVELVCCLEEREERDKECWRGRRRGEENLERELSFNWINTILVGFNLVQNIDHI